MTDKKSPSSQGTHSNTKPDDEGLAEAEAAQDADHERPVPAMTTARRDDASRDEIDRTESEGMIVRPGPGESGMARAGDRAAAVPASGGGADFPQSRSGPK